MLLNRGGQRFCDETIGDHLSTLHVLDQPDARALLITDQRVHEQWMLAPYVEGVEPIDKFQLAYKRGARAAIAEDIEELAYLPEEWGYDGEAARDALLEYNRQCEAGELEPGRRLDPAPLVTAPVLRDRGHPRDHLHLHRPADRRARARARRRWRADSRAAGRRCGRRRRVPSRLRRRPRGRAGVRPAGRGHRHAELDSLARANLAKENRWEHWTAKSPSSRARAAARAARTRSSSPRRARTSSRSTSARTRSARSATTLATPADLDETIAGVEALGRRAVKGVADVRDLDQVIAVVEQGLAELGRIDIVCANAGIGSWAVAWEMTAEQWKDMIDINLTGVFNAARAALPSMVARGEGGSVILTSSTAGLIGYANTAHYTAAKHGVIGLMKVLAQEAGLHGIRVNAICPTTVNTPLVINDGHVPAVRAAPGEPGAGRRARAVREPEHPARRAVDRALGRVRARSPSWRPTPRSTSPASRCRSTPATSSRRDRDERPRASS